MQTLALDRSTIVPTVAIGVTNVAALILLAFVAAYWTWQWLGPATEPRALPVAASDSHAVSARGLFGNPSQTSSSALPTVTPIRLLGIVAATGSLRGFAVMRLEPREIITVREGEDIVPGVRLAEVAPEYVVLERGDMRETLAWPDRAAAANPPPLRK